MALLTPQTPAIAGTTITWAAAAGGGDTLAPDARGILLIDNQGVGSINVTVVDPRLVGDTGAANPDLVIAVGAGVMKAISGFGDLGDPTTGLVNVTYSGVTTVFDAYLTL